MLFYHANLILSGAGAMGQSRILVRGYLGVDLFFVLSGFVLAMTYGAGLAALRLEAIRHFYLGRAFRVLPLHWTVLVAFAAVAPMMAGLWFIQSPHSAPNWLASFFLVQTWVGLGQTWNTPAWSLSAEWAAYLTFPALAWATWRVQKGWHAALLSAASLTALAGLTFARSRNVLYGDPEHLGMLRCGTEFMAGMLAFRLAEIMPGVRRWGDFCVIAGVALLGVALLSKIDGPAPFGFVLIVLGCWCEARTATALLGNRLVFWLGKISFSLYIVHWFLIECAFGLLGGGPLGSKDPTTATEAVTLALISALPIAALLNRYVENRSHDIARLILRRERKVGAELAAQR